MTPWAWGLVLGGGAGLILGACLGLFLAALLGISSWENRSEEMNAMWAHGYNYAMQKIRAYYLRTKREDLSWTAIAPTAAPPPFSKENGGGFGTG